MSSIIIHNKVKDYDVWKLVFDEHEAVRKTYGSTGSATIFRGVDDPNELAILLPWDNIENAKKFASSDDLKKAMQKAGVISKPEVYLLG